MKTKKKVIESITSHREAQPGLDAVYMLMPTSANVDRIIRDFSGGRQQYAGAHLFFIDGPSQLFHSHFLTSSRNGKQVCRMSSSNDSRLRPPNRSCVACRTSTSTFGVCSLPGGVGP
jgi:hypothetical protein